MFKVVKSFMLISFILSVSGKRQGRSAEVDDDRSSLAFVFDTTGSMHNDLRQLREGAEMILNTALKESNVIADFVFVPFHDPAVGPATVTRNKEVFKRALSLVEVYGGGDCPEKSLTGIQMALDVSRPKSFLYVFTDATAGDHRTVAKVLDAVQRKQSQVVFILTGHCNDLDKPSYQVYQQIAAASSGQIFNLNKASVHKMLEFVKSSIKGRTVNLASVTNPAGYNYTQSIPVDSSLGEVTVSVSGAKPKITVVDPNGEQLTGPPKLITTLDLSEIMVVKVLQPEPGNYLIKVGSTEDYSVKVVGLSNLTFNHGFSVQKPKTPQETSYRPLKGAYNHMMISLSQDNVTADIKFAEILTLDGRTLFEVPLTEVNHTNKVYMAEPFIPPDDFFYIAINGRDQYNQELRRIGTTAIQPKSPEVPYLTVPRLVEAHAHSRVVSTCNAESLVPLSALWTKDSTRIQEKTTSLQTTSIDYVIEDMSEEHVGTYRCIAQNTAGMSKAITILTIIVDPPQVSISPQNKTVRAGDSVTISCTVFSEALLLENRFIFTGPHSHYVTDIDKEPNIEATYTYRKTVQVSENEAGVYSCVAANRGGTTKQSAKISLQLDPTARILGPHTLTKLINTDFQLVCGVENAQVIVWYGPSNTEVKRLEVNGPYNDILYVKNVTGDGVWTCTALGEVKNSSDSVRVSVLIKPVVSIMGDKNITVLNGTVVEVRCRVIAKPEPRILWHRETETFLNNTITEIQPTIYISVLRLDSRVESINSTYFCFGENSEGINQDSVIVNVRRKMTVLQGFTDKSVQLYYQIELPCIVDSYPVGVIHWYHNDTLLVPNDNVALSEDGTMVYLTRVDFDDLGEYKCEVENEYEKVQVKGVVSVEGLAPPILSKEPASLATLEGRSTIITCRLLQGYPEPTISWQYKGVNSSQFNSLPEDIITNVDNTEVSISNVRGIHGGTYRCLALNLIGQDLYDVTLVVQYPPKLVKEDTNIPFQVKLGESVKLSCEASGVPPPVTVWNKRGRPVLFTEHISVSNTSELQIQARSAQDSGTFTCDVTNTAGTVSRNFTVIVYDPPKFVKVGADTNKSFQVKLGESVKLSCEASGVPPPVTVWNKHGRPVVFTEHISVSNTSELQIQARSAQDSGTYTCDVTNTAGTVSRNFTVTVYDPPKFVKVKEDTNKPFQVKLGESVKLSCEASGVPPPVTVWNKHRLPIVFTEHISVSNASELQIQARSAQDSGTYTCDVTNTAGIVSRNFTVTVYDPPTISSQSDHLQEVVEGQLVELPCTARGLPAPTVEWTRNDQPIDNEKIVDGYGLRFVSKVTDTGEYSCTVTNMYGQATVSYTVHVWDPPKLINDSTYVDEPFQVKLGESVKLSCEASGVPPPVTVWNKHGRPLVLTKYISVSNTSELQIQARSAQDSGTYTCDVTNTAGTVSRNFTVYVYDLPKFVKVGADTNKSFQVKLGESVKLSCEASGVPPPVTVWNKHGRPVVFTEHISVSNTSELQIQARSAQDSGTYTCDVTNTAGTVSRNFTVTVYDPPKFVKVKEDTNKPFQVKLGESVKLSCEASGVPPPVTVWNKHGLPIVFTEHIISVSNTSELQIQARSAQDSGTYTCDVTNTAGTVSRNFTVNVYDPPKISSHSDPLQEVVEGQLVELPCTARGLPTPIVEWTRTDQPIDNEKIVDGYGLRFVSKLTDTGEYSCTVTNMYGHATVSYTVHVWDPPKLINDSTYVDEPFQVKLGESVKLSCEASGVPPPVTVWNKHGRPLVFTEHISVSNTSELQIQARSAQDSGTYTCDVTNTAGTVSRNFTVNVYDPPVIKVKEDTNRPFQVKLGESMKLSCEASGVPPPVTVWNKYGLPIVFTEHIYITTSNELQIEARSIHESGTYTCNVTSTVGSTSKNFTVTVYDPPTISSHSDPLQEVVEGQLVELPCTARGLPTPTVGWTLNGEKISNEKHVDENGLRFVANLTDFGEFVCTASNIYGNASFTYILHVWVPPHIKPLRERTKEVLLGNNMTLQCDVVGFPLPSVQWAFNGKLLIANTTVVSFNDIGNIYVTNTTFNHEGVYTCIAENFGGTDEQSVYIKIIDPPKIIEDNYTGTYIATDIDTVLSVSCRATGKPKPYYMWIKDEFYLNNDPRYSIDFDGTLHIKSPTVDMSGNYTCVARNSVGQATKIVPVEIYSLPSYTLSEEALSTVTVVEGSEADIECPLRATAHTLKWYKNAKLISTGNLHLRNITRADSSTYSCVVSNAVGSAHSRVQVLVEWAPRFVAEEDRDVERVRGDDCYFHCDVDAKPSAKTRWVFNSKPLVFEDKSQLKIFDVQLHNAGTYKCIVSNVHGTVVKEFKLTVLEPPFISDFDLMDVQLKEGDNATLECNAHGTPTPTVTWTYNNSNWQVHKTSLSAVNMSMSYEGVYRCDASNRAGVTHLVYRVTVVSAPRVQEVVAFVGGEGTSVVGTVEIVQGSNIRIACKASGNPVPDIQWVRQGRAVSENQHDIDYADLTLRRVDTRQNGLYTCVASNEGGTDSRRIKLDVLEPPKIFQSLFETNNSSEVNMEVISGQSFYLHCHPYGNPMPELYWFKNEVPLKLFDETMVSTEFGEVIEVKEAVEEQSGNYTCVARNKVGNTTLSYLVDVLVPPPTPKESLKNVTVKFGTQLVLQCPSVGTRPIAMWIKHPYTEIYPNSRISLTDDHFILTINKTVVSDSGKYACILINRVGSTEVTFDVIVLKRPTIAGNVGANNVEAHVVPLRRSIVLKCEADGHPTPELTWLKDTQELSSSASNIHRVLGNSLLAIWGASVRDAGQYICMAENRAGYAHRRYNIAIQVPAKWSGWSSWSYCNVTCGVGYQTRSRVCHYVDEHNNTYDSSSNSEKIVLDETACKGPKEDKLKCQMHPCDLDSDVAHWSRWSRWSACSSSCGAGTQARTRRCSSRAARCQGDNVEIKKCTGLPPCNQSADPLSNDVLDSDEDISDNNPYIPEMTFESQPEVVSHYSPNVEQFYSASGSQAAVFYDVNVTRNLDSSERGPCDPGYTHNVSTNTCDDVDECLVESNECHLTQVCVNTLGGYRCSCSPGYLSLAPGQRCMDINECEMDTAGCEFACVNTAGGYVCACPRHLRLHVDRHHCVTPSLYRRPYAEIESEYLSTTVDFPARYTRGNRNK